MLKECAIIELHFFEKCPSFVKKDCIVIVHIAYDTAPPFSEIKLQEELFTE